MKAQSFLSKEEQNHIITAIEAAELATSGEIRVHIESRCKEDVISRATAVFHALKMDTTKERNGVLIYVAYQSRNFAVIGDSGINAQVPANFWSQITEQMRTSFAKGDFCGGICRAVYAAGGQLARYFPYRSGDVNELPNEISFDE